MSTATTPAPSLEEVWRLFHENARQMLESRQETDRQLRDLKEAVERTGRHVDDLSSKWGRFVEGMVAPACTTLFAARGIPVHKVSQRVKARLDDGRNMEIDVLVINERFVVLVEVKSTLKVQDVDDHLERLGLFKGFFPEYAERQVLGAVAGMVIDEGADCYAYRKGLYVIGQRGETVALLNDAAFQARAW
jgi:predicted glycoside hydrolase/deacetylase ChbG (UPF0249 family)